MAPCPHQRGIDPHPHCSLYSTVGTRAGHARGAKEHEAAAEPLDWRQLRGPPPREAIPVGSRREKGSGVPRSVGVGRATVARPEKGPSAAPLRRRVRGGCWASRRRVRVGRWARAAAPRSIADECARSQSIRSIHMSRPGPGPAGRTVSIVFLPRALLMLPTVTQHVIGVNR